MTDSINIVFDEDGVAREYDDTYDIVIHCESKEEQDQVCEKIAQRLEVIQCKDCKKWQTDALKLAGKHFCLRVRDYTTEHDYCSFAERRSDETENTTEGA